MTYFVVQPLLRSTKPGRVIMGDALEVESAAAARRRVNLVAEGRVRDVLGAIAFSRTGDPSTGDWEEGQILAIGGQVPPELLEEPIA